MCLFHSLSVFIINVNFGKRTKVPWALLRLGSQQEWFVYETVQSNDALRTPANTYTLLLQTVCFVPAKKSRHIFSKFNQLKMRALITDNF